MDANSFLDTSAGQNTDVTFSRLLRQTQKQRSKDLGPASFRYRNTTAERLLEAELSTFNSHPIKGVQKYEKTKKRLFMPETVTWYLPVAENNSHYIEIGPTSKWEKNLPRVKDASKLHPHLHEKIHFKSTS